MVTKNFLFSLFITSLFISGCTTVSHHQRYTGDYSGNGGTTDHESTTATTPTVTVQNIPTPVAPVVTPPNGQALPVGIFLGPGALRSFAHIGVLRALQRAQVPVVAIGGLEWGSIIAASYALSKGANEVEWQMMKLRQDQLPSSSLLHREINAQDPQELFGFLKTAFGDKDLSQGNIPFKCPTTDGEDVLFVGQGKAREQLIRCAALPPLYSFYERAGKRWIAGAVSPGDWPGELRKMGAKYIIYVDVIGRGAMLSASKYAGETQLRALWFAVKGISRQQQAFANTVIEVPMDMDLTDFEHRRDAIAAGEKAAQAQVDNILKNIGVR